MYITLLSIILIYQITVSVLDVKEIKKYDGLEITEKIRIKYYKENILYGWIPVVFVFLFVLLTPLDLNDLGFRPINLNYNIWLNIITLTISGVMLALLLYQITMCILSKPYQKQIENIMNSKRNKNYSDKVILKFFVPRTKKEKGWYSFVSLTAGIGEEIIWRGALLFLLQNIFPTLNIIAVFIISCVIFGLIHSYQGLHGVLKTGVIAILFVLLYYVTDSILPGMILHFIFDFSSTFFMNDKDDIENNIGKKIAA